MGGDRQPVRAAADADRPSRPAAAERHPGARRRPPAQPQRAVRTAYRVPPPSRVAYPLICIKPG